MRRILTLVMLAALAGTAGCRRQPQGTIKVLVIGSAPSLHDPSLGPLSPSDQILIGNVAQGLVRLDGSANIVSGLAERWTVTDDGLDYIFRIASANWPDGTKITAQQVARILKREIGPHSKNSLKDQFGAVDNIVAMTDRVIEISLIAPRSDFLSLLAQPQMAIVRNGKGSGPFVATLGQNGQIALRRLTVASEDEAPKKEEILLEATSQKAALQSFAAASSDLVLGGTFLDLPEAKRAQLPRDSLRFDPAAGLFGLVPQRAGGPLDKPEVRQLLSAAIDRANFVAMLGVAGLVPRGTVLEPGLDGTAPPSEPAWAAIPLANRLPALKAQADRLFGKKPRPRIEIALPEGTGADLLLRRLQSDWGALGFSVDRAPSSSSGDFLLIDKVAPSSSPAWYVRQFRCSVVPVCDQAADVLMDGARQTPVEAQRYALLQQAAAEIEKSQLFLPITAPVRWSLVSPRIQNFVPNRYARHALTDLETRASSDE